MVKTGRTAFEIDQLGVSTREILFLGTVHILFQTEEDGFKIVLWI